MSNKNVTLKEKVNGVVGDVLLPNTTAANVYDAAKSQALSQTLVNTPDKAAVGYPPFSELSNYAVGDKVYKDNKVYRFTEAHPAGSWNSGHVEPWSAKADIDAILALIPSDATSSNKLADKAYVDNSVATDSATFRGTYNEVSDLELTPAATRTEIATALASAISTADNNDYAFVQIPTDASTPTEIARIERYKFNGSAWAFEYELNNSGFTTAQWAAINSGITTEKVAKLDALPTAANLYTKEEVDAMIADIKEEYLKKGDYSADTAVGLADQLRGSVYADEQFALRMTGGEANEVGGIGVVQQLKGAGAAISQLFPEGANHDFSGDVSLDGTSGNADAPLRYSNAAGTVEMGYLLCLEAFVSQTLTQEQLDAISEKDSGKADRDKAVWLTPAGAITSAPTIESGQTEVTFSGWRIAMRVKASEVRDASASSYWFTSGTAGRQVYDVAVAEGIDGTQLSATAWNFYLANGWNTGSAMEYLNHMAAQGLPTHSVKAMSALLSVTKIGIKTVKSRNLLNPQTGRALLKAYVNDDENFLDNEYTMLGGLPSGSTMAFTSLLTGKTETLTMLDSTHFVIPSDGWLQITGTLPESIIATWDGTKDNTAADEYATESHVWDVPQLFGTKDGGTEGHYYRAFGEGMRGVGTAQDVVELVGAMGTNNVGDVDLGTLNWSLYGSEGVYNSVLPSTAIEVSTFNTAFKSFLTQEYGHFAYNNPANIIQGKGTYRRYTGAGSRQYVIKDENILSSDIVDGKIAKLNGVMCFYELATPLTFTSLFLSASSTSDELTQMPADAIPLSEIQFADNNWSIEEAIYDAPEADANGVIDTIHQCTGQMRIQYSLDAAEQIDTLKKEYQALEARVTALENA